MQEQQDVIVKKLNDEVEDTVAKELLLKMVDVVNHCLKTNVYVENRYSLGLRLDPRIMENKENPRAEIPYGIMFCHGRRFNAFHERFRDIARGGMRLVTPLSEEQHALESARQYDECYDLAYSQQLKNKDIPEGGSKAVNLIDCHGLSCDAKHFVMRKSVKACVNTILDLIVEDDGIQEKSMDYLGEKEVLYLGPDEQVRILVHLFNNIVTKSSEYTTFDSNDLRTVLDSGIMVFGMMSIPNTSSEGEISKAVRENLKRNILCGDLDLGTGKVAAAVAIADDSTLDSIPQEYLDNAFNQLNRTLQAGNTVHQGIYKGTRQGLSIFTTIGGVETPQGKLDALLKASE